MQNALNKNTELIMKERIKVLLGQLKPIYAIYFADLMVKLWGYIFVMLSNKIGV
jgi:hypothetical protein